MTSVKLLAASVVLAFAVAPPASAQDAGSSDAELALAREVVDLGYPAGEREAMFFATMDQMTAQMREAVLKSLPAPDPGALAILDDWIAEYTGKSKTTLRLHIPGLMDAVAFAYVDMFTETELRDLRNFLATPSGRGFLNRSTQILANPHFARANQAYMDSVMADLPGAQAELRSRLIAHFEKLAAKAKSAK